MYRFLVILYYIIYKLIIIGIYAPNEDNGATVKDIIINQLYIKYKVRYLSIYNYILQL